MRVLTDHAVLAAVGLAVAAMAARDASSQGVCDGVAPVANTNLARYTVASGMTTGTSGPLFITAPPGDKNRIFIVLQNGIIRQLARGAAPTAHTVFLDIDARVNSTNDEQGLLGLAFSPNFAVDGFFYVNYIRADGDTIVSRFRTVDGTPNTVGDPTSEKILYRLDQPEPNHNGGWMSFGADGFLYIAQGDGGGAGDGHGVCGNGQNLQSALGKILRIDPTASVGTPPDCGLDAGEYTIPPGNPFADGAGAGNCDEIWIYGLRNPWRDSFDAGTGDLYIGDVGQGCWEEVNWIPGATAAGRNLGWRLFEGRHCYNASQGCTATNSPAGCSPACSDPAPAGDAVPNGTTVPILEYNSGPGPACTVVSGYVYRGCRMTNFQRQYFYGDYCAGTIFSFEQVGGVAVNPQTWTTQLGTDLAFDLTSFGTDGQGELYIADRDGQVYAVQPPWPDYETSGTGSGAPFRLNKGGPWTWEDMRTATWQAVTTYRVYRADIADGVFHPGELFQCAFTGTTNSWPTGDPTDPLPDRWFAYLVTAFNGTGAQTGPGGSPPRSLGILACP